MGSEGVAPQSFIFALDGVECSTSRSGNITAEKRAHGTQWIGDWVGPRASLDSVE
jgi:hypothetical protein